MPVDYSLLPKRKHKEGKKQRKWGRNRVKCTRYRNRVGKPRGPGVAGQKRH